MALSDRYRRPRAYDDGIYQWHIGKVPEKTKALDGTMADNPALTNGIFLVHGMGTQKWAETTAILRVGLEVALERIHAKSSVELKPAEETPPPYIGEGFWANYDDFKESFTDESKSLDDAKREFFSMVWKRRSISAMRTIVFFLTQLFKLINPSVIWRIHPFAWLLYIPLQLVVPAGLLILLVIAPRIIARILGDVRLYIAPNGIIERTIVQQIDRRVGVAFLKMIGLDWEFKPLNENEKIQRNGKPVTFDRIIWVAHSLGSVISYNVLSDLFSRADLLEKSGTAEQNEGVIRFRRSLGRFITLGSPLDKIAFLFGKESLRSWPKVSRADLVTSSRAVRPPDMPRPKDFWVNFYHVLDPVSGALSNSSICGDTPPTNLHAGLVKIPGLAHVGYWHDKSALEYILSRVYGLGLLPVPTIRRYPAWFLTLLAMLGYIIWSELILAFLSLILSAVTWLLTIAGWMGVADFIEHVNNLLKVLIPFL
jgi:hypothetical protein